MEQNKQKIGLEAARSPEGFIIDQARVTDVRFGCRTSNVNGCGWIATYNLLRALGDPVSPGTVASALEKHTLLFGLLGTNPLGVRRELRRRGYPMQTALGRKRAVLACAQAVAGILVYRHSGGWHFVAFVRRESGLLRFYNAVAGACAYERTMEAFLREQNRAKVVWLLYLDADA